MHKTYYFLFMFTVAALLLLPQQGFTQGYVGPERCLECHGAIKMDASGWRSSMHANGYSYVPDDSHSMEDLFGIINDWAPDGVPNGIDDFKDGLDFNTLPDSVNPFKDFKPNAPILAYSAQDGYTVTIGTRTHKVYMTYGGSGLYKQRYMVKINTDEGESNDYYISPVQFNDKTHAYAKPYHPETWYNTATDNLPIDYTTRALAGTKGKSLAKGCSGCHATGLELVNDGDEWVMSAAGVKDDAPYATLNNVFDIDGDGDLDQINTTCERCHGPGKTHADTTMSAADIINPKTDLTAEQANNLCGMCHNRGKSKPNNTFGFPFADDQDLLATWSTWSVGDLVANIFTDGGGDWPDGKTSKKHRQQYLGFIESNKPAHQVTCYQCHDVHNTEKHHMRTEITEDGVAIATENDNNTLCLACHAGEGEFSNLRSTTIANIIDPDSLALVTKEVQRHTRHPYDPEGTGASRCSKCHNPKAAKSAVAYDIHSHTFQVLSPQNTLDLIMPNSCAFCHDDNAFGEGAKDSLIAVWDNPEDVTIATWGANYFPMWDAPQQIGVLEALQIPAGGTEPVLDGIADAIWSEVPSDTVNLIVDGVHNSAMWVELKALYTDTDLFMYAKWPDTSMTVRRQELVYQDGTWATSAETDLIREDRIGIFWPMTEIGDFESRGCLATCHNTRERWGKYIDAGELGDMWHLKGARSLPGGYVDDKFLNSTVDMGGDGGRHGDASGSTFVYGNNLSSGAPQWMGPAHDTDPAALYDDTWAAEPFPGTWAVAAQTYDANAGWVNGDRLPKYVMTTPVPGGARSDVRAGGKWTDGYWTVEMKRALDTGDTEHDVIFNDLSKDYMFAVMTIDNGTQPAGRVFPNLHAHQGGNYELLNFSDVVVSVEETLAENVPESYELAQNYPNPFNPTTNIEFDVAQQGKVTLKVFNILGEEVVTVIDKVMPAGHQSVTFDGASLATGVYFYRLEVNDFAQTKKMLLMK